MQNLWTIFRRELAAYYTSAIGYIFMIVFLSLSVGLFMTPFFTFLTADMRAFFSTLPILMCIFLPAVTMRVWAEERKQNTWEMLLTFPMQPYELVLGKFAASLVFFLSALAGTLTVPLMLFVLGTPDIGPILGAYLGSLLLGAFFLAFGLFVSSLCRDQIVAFVVTLLGCFGVLLLGMEFIAAYIDGAWPGLGSFLAQVLGVTAHYSSFTKGLLVLGDVLYFLIWTMIFLFLNGLFLDIRSRPAARHAFVVAVALCGGIGLLANWLLSGQNLGRFDLTADKIYTLSEASVKILRSLKAPVQVNLYITPKDKMPTEMQRLEQDILDKLAEMRLASNGQLLAKAIHMETTSVLQQPEKESKSAEGGSEAEALEKRLLDKGVRPFSVQALREDEVVNKLVYAALGIAYKEKDEEILPRMLPDDLDTLEYRLINTLYKLSRETPPTVALVAPKDALNIPPYMRQLYAQMGRPVPQMEDPYETLERILRLEKYDVRRVELAAGAGIPAQASTVLVINPQNLSERQRWELNRALHEGKSVLLALQQYRWNYSVVQKSISISKEDQKPDVNPWLSQYGLELDPRILLDVNHQSLTVREADNIMSALMGGGVTLNLPMHIMIPQDSMNRKVSITSNLSPLFYLWGSALTLQPEVLSRLQLEHTVLFSTSPKAWSVPGDAQLSQADLQPPAQGQQRPLAVLVRGQFPDVYAGKERPAWPPTPTQPGMPPAPPRQEDPPAKAPTPAPGKLLVLGNAQMFHRNFLSGGNLDFFLNSVDALTLGDEIIDVRSKKPINRTISKPSAEARQFWKFVNLGLVNILIAALGIGGALLRRRARAAYTLAPGA